MRKRDLHPVPALRDSRNIVPVMAPVCSALSANPSPKIMVGSAGGVPKGAGKGMEGWAWEVTGDRSEVAPGKAGVGVKSPKQTGSPQPGAFWGWGVPSCPEDIPQPLGVGMGGQEV